MPLHESGTDGRAAGAPLPAFDGTRWTQLPSCPSARSRTGPTWDLQRNVAVMSGVTQTTVTPPGAETREWNGTTWTRMTTATSPYTNGGIGIVSPGFTYDASRQRVVMTCGAISSSAGTGYQNETWEYDGTDRVSRGTFPVLEVRGGPAVEFVPAHGRTYLFGGFNPNGVFTSNTAFPNIDNRLFEYFTNHVASFMPSATATGCTSSAGTVPAISAAALPWAGETALIDVAGIPNAAATFALLGFGTGSTPLGVIGAL